jgi:hypothetical protein
MATDPRDEVRKSTPKLLCPSAQPQLRGSVVFANVERKSPGQNVSFLRSSFPISDGTMFALAGDVLRPNEVFRFAAPCEQAGCTNWSGAHCRVAERLVQILPVSSIDLPACAIRSECRWFAQEGSAACMRCSQVVTNSAGFEAALNRETPMAKSEAL